MTFHQFCKASGAALFALLLCPAAEGAGWTAKLSNGQELTIVEGATATTSGYFLERRYGAGIRDPQFGSGGRSFFTMGNDNSPPATVQVDTAGRILVSGSTEAANGRSAAVVLRFLPSGQLDPGWGQQGRSVIEAPRGNAVGVDSLALAEGKVLVIGTIEDDPNERAALWRLGENGLLDTTFGTAGLMLAAALPQSQGVSLQQSTDGTLHIALQTGRGDRTWLEVHRWTANAARPVRFARQEFPDEWVGPPVLVQRGESWIWTDASQPLTQPLPLVAAPGESVWTVPTTVAAATRVDTASPAGHAAVNPFNEPGAGSAAPTAITLDDLTWPGALLAILALLGAATWWWWRNG